AKARADRLDAVLRERSDEVDVLTRQVTALRGQQGLDTSVASLLCSLAAAGRLGAAELASLGTVVDGQVALPARCPNCHEGEPELSEVDDGFEFTCPECEHTSGTGATKLAAYARFMAGKHSHEQA
ncbi:DNA-binding protein, partial [Paraburkholderia sp. BR14261]